MAKHLLKPHPVAPTHAVTGVEVELWTDEPDKVLIQFVVLGGDLVLPGRRMPERRNALWQTTCFELFLQPFGTKRYYEFNCSPSTEWAAYSFDDYRTGMRDLILPVAPFIEIDAGASRVAIDVDLDLAAVPGVPLRMGLSAVIEERGGHKSYWALAHPNPDRPDFHDPACFTLELPPPLAK